MLKALQKALSGSKPEEQLTEAVEVVVEASTQSVEQSLAVQLQEAIGVVEQLNAVIAEKDISLAELLAKVESLSAYAEKAEAEAKALAEQAKMKEVESRKEKLASVIGSENPGFDATFAAVSSLDEANFNVVVDAMAAARKAEADSEMFKQVGVSGEAETKPDDGVSLEMRILQQKYHSK